jgi:hypothetical protein
MLNETPRGNAGTMRSLLNILNGTCVSDHMQYIDFRIFVIHNHPFLTKAFLFFLFMGGAPSLFRL